MLATNRPLLAHSPVTEEPHPRFQQLRIQLALILESNAWHWTIITLSSIEFGLSFSEIINDYLDASNLCKCTDTCEESSIFETLEWTSLFITTLFLIEIPLDLFAFGPKYYLPHGTPHWFLHLFDAIVVIGAFVLSLRSQGPLESVVSLLIILRLWRILKLVLSLEMGKEELQEAQNSRRDDKIDEKRNSNRRERQRSAEEEETVSSGSDSEDKERWKREVQRLRRRVRELESRE